MCLENAFLGQKGRKIYVEAQNARETSQKAEFEGEKPSCGVKNKKGGDVAATCGAGLLFLRESAKGALKRRAACAPEQIGTETERIGTQTERIGAETERIGAQAERVGGNILADHAAKQQAIAQDSEEAAPRAREARALCVCGACATRAQLVRNARFARRF